MAVNTETEEEKPLDPATERVRRKMVRLLVVSIGVMMVGLMAVLGAIVYKIGNTGDTDRSGAGAETANGSIPVEPGFEGRVDLPQGAEIISTALDGDNILLQLRLAQGGRQFVIHSISRNRIIARLMLD
jgi:hypothetical protein